MKKNTHVLDWQVPPFPQIPRHPVHPAYCQRFFRRLRNMCNREEDDIEEDSVPADEEDEIDDKLSETDVFEDTSSFTKTGVDSQPRCSSPVQLSMSER